MGNHTTLSHTKLLYHTTLSHTALHYHTPHYTITHNDTMCMGYGIWATMATWAARAGIHSPHYTITHLDTITPHHTTLSHHNTLSHHTTLHYHTTIHYHSPLFHNNTPIICDSRWCKR